jgi:hypothetical protein
VTRLHDGTQAFAGFTRRVNLICLLTARLCSMPVLLCLNHLDYPSHVTLSCSLNRPCVARDGHRHYLLDHLPTVPFGKKCYLVRVIRPPMAIRVRFTNMILRCERWREVDARDPGISLGDVLKKMRRYLAVSPLSFERGPCTVTEKRALPQDQGFQLWHLAEYVLNIVSRGNPCACW